MIRGTTPTHSFTLPFDTRLLSCVRIVYAQKGNVVFVKTGENVTLRENTIETTLTQEETLSLNCTSPVEIQVRVLTDDGTAMNSDIVLVPVSRCLENEVIE